MCLVGLYPLTVNAYQTVTKHTKIHQRKLVFFVINLLQGFQNAI